MFCQGSSILRVLHGLFKSIRNQSTTVSTDCLLTQKNKHQPKKKTKPGHTFLLLLPYGLYRRVVKLMNVLLCRYYFLPAFLNISCFYVPDRKIKEEETNKKKPNEYNLKVYTL